MPPHSDVTSSPSWESLVSAYRHQQKESIRFTKSSRKSVRFTITKGVREVPSRSTFSEEEKAMAWYSSAECKLLRSRATRTIKKMMKGADVDKDGNDSIRGLEHYLPDEDRIRRYRKSGIIWSVLGEQERQLTENPGRQWLDSEGIAQLYTLLSEPCASEAYERGLDDMLAAAPADSPKR